MPLTRNWRVKRRAIRHGQQSHAAEVSALGDRIAHPIMLLGIALLVVPTLYKVGRQYWTSELGAYGPIIFAISAWLLVQAKSLILKSIRRQFVILSIAPILIPLGIYYYGAVTSSLGLESLGLYAVLLTIVIARAGLQAASRAWFALFYPLFLVVPPANYITALTQPLKIAISSLCVHALQAMGLPIANTGVQITVGPYRLLMAEACSGLNSIISIMAVTAFYINFRHNGNVIRSLILAAAIIPIAILVNIARVILLIIFTFYGGAELGSGFAHIFAGAGLFLLSLAMLYGLDSGVDYCLVRRGDFRSHAWRY